MKKPIKIVIATALGLSLFLAGTSYIVWVADETRTTEAKIRDSQPTVNAVDAGHWFDWKRSSGNSTAVEYTIPDIGSYRVVPNETIAYAQKFQLQKAQANTTVGVNFNEQIQQGVAALRDRGIMLTVTLKDANGNDLATSSNQEDYLGLSYQAQQALGDSFVDLVFVFDVSSSVTDEDTKNMQVLISDSVVSIVPSK